MYLKPKNILITLLISLALVFTASQVLAEPATPEEIDEEFQKFEEEKFKCESIKCDNLGSKEEEEKCLSESIKCITDLQNQLSKWSKGKLGEIKEKAEELQDDKKSLENQIGYLNARVDKTEVEVKVTEQQINLIDLDISRTEKEIKNTGEGIKSTENKIRETKEKLADGIRNLYEYDNQNLVKLTLSEGNLSDFFDEIVYIENFQKEIGENLNKLKEDKKGLEEKKLGLEKQKENLKGKKEEVVSKINSLNKTIAELDSSKREKAVLLEITEGDEEKYQELLSAIKAQTDQLLSNLANLAQQRKTEIEELIAKYGEIPTGLFNVPLFLQTNYSGNLGPSHYSFSGNGCAVTSVAMVLAYYGLNVNPMTLNNDWKNIFSCTSGGFAFCWYGVTNDPYNMNLSGQIGHSYGTNVNIDQHFAPGKPIIIFLNTLTNGTSGHYVVVVGKVNGKYVVNDPILGTVYLDVSKEFIENAYNSTVTIDQVIIYTP